MYTNHNENLDIAGLTFKVITASHPLKDDKGRFVIDVELDARFIWVDPDADAHQRLRALDEAVSMIENELTRSMPPSQEMMSARTRDKWQAGFEDAMRKIMGA